MREARTAMLQYFIATASWLSLARTTRHPAAMRWLATAGHPHHPVR
jgi:hypothetical protein